MRSGPLVILSLAMLLLTTPFQGSASPVPMFQDDAGSGGDAPADPANGVPVDYRVEYEGALTGSRLWTQDVGIDTVDVYVFNVPIPAQVTLSGDHLPTEGVGPLGQLSFEMLDPEGDLISYAASLASSPVESNVELESPGEYALRISAAIGAYTRYAFSLDIGSEDPNTYTFKGPGVWRATILSDGMASVETHHASGPTDNDRAIAIGSAVFEPTREFTEGGYRPLSLGGSVNGHAVQGPAISGPSESSAATGMLPNGSVLTVFTNGKAHFEITVQDGEAVDGEAYGPEHLVRLGPEAALAAQAGTVGASTGWETSWETEGAFAALADCLSPCTITDPSGESHTAPIAIAGTEPGTWHAEMRPGAQWTVHDTWLVGVDLGALEESTP